MYRVGFAALLASASGACTPLGLWVYEEPKVEVTGIAVDPTADAQFPVQIGLSVSNANDFEVSLIRVQVRFLVGGNTLVERELPTAALFPARDRQTVKIGVSSADLVPGARQRAVPGASQKYFLDGYALLKTPLGERRIPFLRTGVGLNAPELARAS